MVRFIGKFLAYSISLLPQSWRNRLGVVYLSVTAYKESEITGFTYWARVKKLSEIHQEFLDNGYMIVIWREDGVLNKELSEWQEGEGENAFI